jgi:cell shape-determining protein MreC
VEQKILFLSEAPGCHQSRELRAIALEVRKREDRIKQLEEENDAMRADLLLWKDWVEEERRKP